MQLGGTVGRETSLLPWRPTYLRLVVLIIFGCIFAAVIAAPEVLLRVSVANNGLGTADARQQYLWKYGPTAILTVVAALWGRVEYQSKLAAPWVRLSQPSDAPNAGQTLKLDYITCLQPTALFRSLRNRDFVVALAVSTSIMMKILILLSTGLLASSWIDAYRIVHPMVTIDQFADDTSSLSVPSDIAYYITEGVLRQNLSYPGGLSKDYAFQSVRSNLPANTRVQTTVDGFTSWLDCQTVFATVVGIQAEEHIHFRRQMNITISSPGCNIENLPGSSPFYSGGNSNKTSVLPFARFMPAQCDGTTGDSGRRIFVLFANVTYEIDYTQNTTDYTGNVVRHPIFGTVTQSAPLLCVPAYSITKVDVVHNGTHTLSVTRSPGAQNRTLPSVSPWKLFDAHLKSYANDIENIQRTRYEGLSMNISGVPVDVDAPMSDALFSQTIPGVTQVSSLLVPENLQKVASGHFREVAAVVAKQSLLFPASTPIEGVAYTSGDRLVVRAEIAHAMASISGVCAVMAAIAAFLVPSGGILPRNPSTLAGITALLQHSPGILDRLRGGRAVDEKNLQHHFTDTEVFQSLLNRGPPGSAEFWIRGNPAASNGNPQKGATVLARSNLKARRLTVLDPLVRGGICLFLAALFAVLELLLRKSDSEDGLWKDDVDSYVRYTWTIVPSVVFGLLSVVVSTMDFTTRLCLPYSSLSRGVSSDEFVGLDFVDASIFRVLFRELKWVKLQAFAMTMAFLVASLFTTIAGSLFKTLPRPLSTSIQLRANTSFAVDAGIGFQDKSGLISSLILEANYSYPRFTYGNLAFPQFLLSDESAPISDFNQSSLSITAIVPAVRAEMDCRMYEASKITTNLTLNYSTSYNTHVDPLGISILGEECQLDDSEKYRYNNFLSTYPNTTHFALGDGTDTSSPAQGCSDLLYTWGTLSRSKSSGSVTHIAAMGCNVTFATVPVNVTFRNPNLDIDTSRPPSVHDKSRPSTIGTMGNTNRSSPFYTNSQSGLYMFLATVPTNPSYLLDPFFSLLVTSPQAVSITDFGDSSPDAMGRVADAIRAQHGVILAQVLANARTVPVGETNATLGLLRDGNPDRENGSNDGVPRYSATVIGERDRSGGEGCVVIVDVPSARALQGMIAVVLLGVMAGWIGSGGQEGEVLRRGSCQSIGMAAALVAGGNIGQYLRRDGVEWWSDDEVAAALGPGTKVRLGRGEGRIGKGEGAIVPGRSSYGLWVEGVEGGEVVEMTGLRPG